METGKIKHNFYEPDNIIQAAEDVIRNQFAYSGLFEEFFCDDQILNYVHPFNNCALHDFSAFIAEDFIRNGLSEAESASDKNSILFSDKGNLIPAHDSDLIIEQILDFYGVKHTSFKEWLEEGKRSDFFVNDSEDNYFEELILCGEIEELMDKIATEVSRKIFENPDLLSVFNRIMADRISSCQPDEIEEPEIRKHFSKLGILKEYPIPGNVKNHIRA